MGRSMQPAAPSHRTTVSPLSDFGVGAKEAVLDIVANPWTVGTFALVTTVGTLLMGQDRFPRLKGATCWVMRDGMKGMYYVGLGVSGARAVYHLSEDDYHDAGHAVTLGASIAVTKVVGDRWMQPFLNRTGQAMMRLADRAPGQLADWLRTQGRAMADVAEDRMAASGLALCAHSFDEIAAMVVLLKSLAGSFALESIPDPEPVSMSRMAGPDAPRGLSKWEMTVAFILGLLGGAAFMSMPSISAPAPAFGSGTLMMPYRRSLFSRPDDGA